MVLIWVEWFQHGSHSQTQALSLPSLSFISSCFFFFPLPTSHLSLAAHLTSPCPLYLPSFIILLSNTLAVLLSDLGLTWDLHTWEWVAARGQEALSFPRIYSRALRGRAVGVYEGREAIRGMKTLKPKTLAGGSSFTCQGSARAGCPGHLLYQRCGSTCIGYMR